MTPGGLRALVVSMLLGAALWATFVVVLVWFVNA